MIKVLYVPGVGTVWTAAIIEDDVVVTVGKESSKTRMNAWVDHVLKHRSWETASEPIDLVDRERVQRKHRPLF
jgi:hypothetical protein